MLTRGAHEGGVDAESMDERKISQIVGRMYSSLHPPTSGEGFDEVLRIDDRESAKAALRRIWEVAGQGQGMPLSDTGGYGGDGV